MAFSKSLKNTVLALLVLVIPGICYMLLRTGTNYYKSLPVYGPQGKMTLTDSVPDSAWYRPDLSRFIAPGEEIRALDKKMYVAGFFRGRTSSQAETLAVNMVRVAKTYQDLDRLVFIAFITSDTTIAGDSSLTAGSFSDTAAITRVLDNYGAVGTQWHRRYVPEATLREILGKEFLLEANAEAGSGIPLSDTLVLTDSRRRIRGYYDGSSYFDTDTLEDEIAVLWKEEMNQDDQE